MAENPESLITHFGVVAFENGGYVKQSGSSNWTVQPIPGFGTTPPLRLPMGQVKIEFDAPVHKFYTVILSAQRLRTTPMLMANYGDAESGGFVVHLFDPISTKTLQNASFSFLVLQ